jgi:hypothetical protein
MLSDSAAGSAAAGAPQLPLGLQQQMRPQPTTPAIEMRQQTVRAFDLVLLIVVAS